MMIEHATVRTTVGMLALTSALLVSGCSEIVGFSEPLEYPDAVEYFNGSMFPPLWSELEACSGLHRRLESVGFYYVERETLTSALHGIRTVGEYYPRSNRVFIVASEKSTRAVIRHEMMHALLKDESGHPAKYFGADGLCGYL